MSNITNVINPSNWAGTNLIVTMSTFTSLDGALLYVGATTATSSMFLCNVTAPLSINSGNGTSSWTVSGLLNLSASSGIHFSTTTDFSFTASTNCTFNITSQYNATAATFSFTTTSNDIAMIGLPSLTGSVAAPTHVPPVGYSYVCINTGSGALAYFAA